jgi:broad specificity phosphatase PhoE
MVDYAYTDYPETKLEDFEHCKIILMRHAQSEQNKICAEYENKHGRHSEEFRAFQKKMEQDTGLLDCSLSDEGRL